LTNLDLVGLVRDACELFQTIAEDKQIVIATDLPEQCRLEGDLPRLQRVVANLLDNALKYTPPQGKVTITLAEEGQQVRLSVEDTGIGIPAHEMSRIFRRFYRCDQSRSEHGNGLGLSLAQAFVRALGGNITATSAVGKGSVFAVVLPRSPHGGKPQRQAAARGQAARGELVLVERD
jgi:signal transduction histidine kinase